MKAYLILEDGSVYEGNSIGAVRDCMCEIVFNTSVVGYTEALSDPSYYGQGLVLTYPIVGNYGVNLSDMESNRIWAKCLIVRELSEAASNFRMEITLSDYLCRYGVPGIEGIDTRALTKKLRDKGTMAGFLTTEHFELEEVVKKLTEYKSKNAVKAVTSINKNVIEGSGKRVALMDYGVKKSVVESLEKRNLCVTVFPATTPIEEVIEAKFDGVILSNGPGNPCENKDIIDDAKKLYDLNVPTLCLELGHQIMALAAGCKVEKMTHGHRGSNYPVKFVKDGKCYITSQNHGYAVTEIDEGVAVVSHYNINDGTIEGLSYAGKNIMSFQFAPGGETDFIFDEFVRLMGGKENA